MVGRPPPRGLRASAAPGDLLRLAARARGTGAPRTFTARLLDEAGIVTTPGNGFGDPGEGFIRMTLCSPAERLQEAVQRLRQVSL